jgi:hypothetical protein
MKHARRRARSILDQFPQGGYMTVVENWHQLPDGQIEFTMRRLATADYNLMAVKGPSEVVARAKKSRSLR